MLAYLTDPEMWTALVKIAIINVVLSGDNAVVIALACRSLNPKDQKKAFIIGTAGIVVLMTILTIFAAALMTVPYLQLIGSVLLIWIGIKLLLPEDGNDELKGSSNFWEAVRTIIIADIIMSLDNVLGMAGAAKGHYAMLFLGLLITLMDRFPVFVTIGAALIGYVAGEMVIGDLATHDYIEAHLAFLDKYFVAALGGALIVVVVGKVLGKRKLIAMAAGSGEQARQSDVIA